MAFLTLKDIGKIYVSTTNVAVGIRGINLNFELGEFVAITGKSGSGKSTLLNVISGIDTYEEGDLLIENESTKHFEQKDWEIYRQKYISFIFQDYNVMESCTVLENVELALFNIENAKQRKAKAIELLTRVGLEKHLHQKASKLSGGQKQRCVIARALAKDSPIILADEPTGNLDSATAKEIITLLKEVSKNKLLIMVTHNYEEVKDYATRHIRIFDGSIEYDHQINNANIVDTKEKLNNSNESFTKKTSLLLKNGMIIGKTIFASRPKLSIFMILFLMLGIIALFFTTTVFSSPIKSGFSKNYMFTPIDGRVIVTSRDGTSLTEDELTNLVNKTNAKSYLHYDYLLDDHFYSHNGMLYEDQNLASSSSLHTIYDYDDDYTNIWFNYTYEKTYGKNIIGRYPESEREVFLYLPISTYSYCNKNNYQNLLINFNNVGPYKVVGFKYFYDNTKTAEALFSQKGFEMLTFISYYNGISAQFTLHVETSYVDYESHYSVYDHDFYVFPSYDLKKDEFYFYDRDVSLSSPDITELKLELSITDKDRYDYLTGNRIKPFTAKYNLPKEGLKTDFVIPPSDPYSLNNCYVSYDLIVSLTKEILSNRYPQSSLFYQNNHQAEKAIEEIKEAGYRAVLSNTTYATDLSEKIINTIMSLIILVFYVLIVLFLAIFINLCTKRTLLAYKNDIAIMRSMGIKAKEIKIGMHMRMIICLLIAYLFLTIVALIIYLVPALNRHFTFLHFFDYFLIVASSLLLLYFITKKQFKKLYQVSVKKSLKGESE